MDIYNVLNVITDTTKPIGPTHCGGDNNSPPFLSGADDVDCNTSTNCRQAELSFGSHHRCSTKSIFFCECSRNKDKEEGRWVKHYFVRGKGINESNICTKCQERCK